MTDNDRTRPRPPRAVPHVMDDGQAAVLARLTERYADALVGIRERHPVTSVPLVLQAVKAHQGRRLLKDVIGLKEEPADRAEDVADALSLLQVLRAEVEQMEGDLLLAARSTSSRTGKHLLTFKQIAAALGVESEQAAQGRYRRKVGNLNSGDAGYGGTT